MSKHTAGPWRVGDAGATVFGPPNGQPSPQTVARVTVKANARLIAAAPDLLAALEATLNPLIRLGDFIGNECAGKNGIPPFDRCAIIGQVRGAIDKAGGSNND